MAKKRRFELVSGTSSKFWEIERSGASLTVRYGRIGTKGRTTPRKLANAAAAERAAQKLIAEKLAGGYVEQGASGASRSGSAEGVGLRPVLDALDDALRAYAPKRHARLKRTTDVAALERLAPVHPDLRALWARFDGAAELLFPRASEPDAGGIDLLSASQAASQLADLRKAVSFDAALVPFATDGGGNFLVVDPKGRVLDWDHETRQVSLVAPSLAALLERTSKAIAKRTLFGGPEKKPGKIDPKLERAESLLEKPVENLDRLLNAVPKLDDADAFRILTVLWRSRRAMPKRERARLGVSYLIRAARVGQWAAAFEGGAVAQGGAGEWWAFIGEKALLAGAFDRAGQAFAKDDSLRCQVGAALAAWKQGADAAAAIERAAVAVAKEKQRAEKLLADHAARGQSEPAGPLMLLDSLLLHEATLARARGDEATVAARTEEAERRCGENAALEVCLAEAAGITWRTPA